MKTPHVLLSFLLWTMAWLLPTPSEAQVLTYSVPSRTQAATATVYIYLDASESMQGFWSNPHAPQYVGRIFEAIETRSFNIDVSYYTFADVCGQESVGTRFEKIAKGTQGQGNYNIYSQAISSLKRLRDKQPPTISLLVTDGVPSVHDKHSQAGNLTQRLQAERTDTRDAIQSYLHANPQNVVHIYRYKAHYEGSYSLSDGSGKALPHTGTRNFYILAFTTRQQSSLADDLLRGSIDPSFAVLKLAPNRDDLVATAPEITQLEYKDGVAHFNLSLYTTEKADGLHFQLLSNKGKAEMSTQGVRPVEQPTRSLKQGRYKYTWPCRLMLNVGQYDSIALRLVATNTIATDATAFAALDIDGLNEANVAQEMGTAFHDKTFRLSYLADPVIRLQQPLQGKAMQEDRYAIELPFSIHYINSHWTWAEPLFGLFGLRASMEHFYHVESFYPPYAGQLLLFRWLTPLLALAVVFGLFLNFRTGRVQQPCQQWVIWWAGFAVVLLVVGGGSALFMFRPYDEGNLALSYQLLHQLYNPLFALLLYTVGSALLSRSRWCTAVNNPIPF